MFEMEKSPKLQTEIVKIGNDNYYQQRVFNKQQNLYGMVFVLEYFSNKRQKKKKKKNAKEKYQKSQMTISIRMFISFCFFFFFLLTR